MPGLESWETHLETSSWILPQKLDAPEEMLERLVKAQECAPAHEINRQIPIGRIVPANQCQALALVLVSYAFIRLLITVNAFLKRGVIELTAKFECEVQAFVSASTQGSRLAKRSDELLFHAYYYNLSNRSVQISVNFSI